MKLPWEQVREQALDNLRALIRLDTSNPPGNERIAADYLAAQLERHGLKTVVRESVPTRANLVTRIAGRDPAKPALLLSSHTDVVPVEPSGWSRAPFGAEIAEGCVWGRGALDMKSKCAMDLAVMTALQRAGAIPDCDVIMAAVADEEAGSEYGAKFLVERHPELIRAGYVLNEVGGFTIHFGDRRIYPVQVAEKGFVTIKMTVTDTPGHGSMPRQRTAITRLAELITKIANTPMRRKVTPLMRAALNELGLEPEYAPSLIRPMLSNTVSATVMRAGYKDNVIPGEAWVVLDGRTLPGEDPESFCAELRAIVGEEPGFELIKAAPPAEFSIETPLFALIRRRTEAADPGGRVIPWMIPGATDNKFYGKLGAVCYGFSPVRLEPTMPFGALYHGHNERVPVEGFLWGLKLYAEVVLEFLGLSFEGLFT
jgi:acetylornithine deacetylase/succinyl-diaminopimelate desuccinylase-like protein